MQPLIDKGADGIAETLGVLGKYRLLREDIDSIIELTTWPGKKSLFDRVDAKVKAALTRAYNKNAAAYSYSSMAGVKKKKAAAAGDDDGLPDDIDEEGGGEQVKSCNLDEEDEEDANVENDGLIKAVKKTAAKCAANKSKSGQGSKSSGRGKNRSSK